MSAEIDRLKNIPRAELPDKQLLEQAEKLVWQAIKELQENGVRFDESSRLTPERIAKMQKWLLEHPIDHEYDEMCDMLDSPAPPAQLASRAVYNVLKEIGELPPGVE